ncbi:MAG: hypothetical protein E7591_04540 [Ruminococcaceae bacterium]|nr:hypothetical protein [Oscillospiraceae bacterium]
MLSAGYVFCTRCGRATADAYYHCGEYNCWVQLKRGIFGKIYAELYTPKHLKSDTTVESVTYCAPSKRTRVRTQHQIQISCKLRNGITRNANFTRSCPFCVGTHPDWTGVHNLIPGLGDYPTYVIGMIGNRTVGKTSWIESVSYPENIRKVNSGKLRNTGYSGYILNINQPGEAKVRAPKATPLNDSGSTNIINILRKDEGKKVNETVAQVLLLDFAGELFKRENRDVYNNSVRRLFDGRDGVEGKEGFDGVDGIILMTDPQDYCLQGGINDVFNSVNGTSALFTHVPIAFVMNKIDLMFNDPPEQHLGENPSYPCVPLFSEITFNNLQGEWMYQKDVMVKRIDLENALLKKILPLIAHTETYAKCAGFMVKSTSVTPDTEANEEQELRVNYSDTLNLMDPLLWILNELDIFPIENLK